MNPELIIPVIVAIITAISASGIISIIAQRQKVRADTASSLVDTGLDIVAEYKSQIKELKDEIAKLKAELATAECNLDAAYIEIKRLQEDNKQLNKRIARLEN